MKNGLKVMWALIAPLMFIGCGSSSTTQTTSVAGTVYAAPIAGATVKAKTTAGSTVATATTDSSGAYTLNIPTSNLASDLVIESTGGTYTDEATGTTGVAASIMSAYITGGTLSATANKAYVTASSTIVKELVDGGKTPAEATTAFNSTFGYTPDITRKPDMASTATDATQQAAEKLAGFREAVFSQLVSDLGLPEDHLSDLADALAADLLDGTLDGKEGTTAILISGHHGMGTDIQSKFENATVNWQGSANNTSGLTAADLESLPFAKTALTTTYEVTYVPGTMAASQGKTAFQLKVANKTTGVAVSGLSLTLTPTMYMSSMTHTTPVDSCAANATAGTYDCTAYYLMASGKGMGYWKLKVNLGGTEDAYFYPTVGMAMGTDTVSQTQRFSTDTFSSMGSTSVRPYYIFKNALTAGMNSTYTFKAFIGVRETLTSHKALYTGLSLNSAAFTVNTLVVEASTDATTWTAMTEDTTNKGRYSVSGLTGLTSGTAGTVYVRITVNGNTYNNSSTGTAGGTAKSYATFTVTPGSM